MLPRHRQGPHVRRTAVTPDIVAFKEQPTPAQTPPKAAVAPSTEKIGVLLLNLGGPETLEDVQPFLYNLFADPDIIRLPEAIRFIQPALASVIASLRAPKSAEGYKAIGGGSPLRKITQDQASALATSLRAKGQDAEVYVAMRYWHPYTEEALEQVKRDNITRLVILPLYPQFSISTSGSSLRLLEQMFKSDSQLQGLKHTVIPSWYQRKGYVCAMADLIVDELEKFNSTPGNVEIFFSAHGVPKSYVEEAGDPYKEEMEECVALIMNELKRRGRGNHHTLAYQSRVGPAEWLKPYTDESIRCEGAQQRLEWVVGFRVCGV
jgi:protoporphyrin/coproporphyrin ferrochelatase